MSLKVLRSAVIVGCVSLVCCGIVARARQEKTDADAMQRLRDIHVAEMTFKERHGRFGTIAALTSESLVAPRATAAAENAFRFDFSERANGYAVVAIPARRDDQKEYIGWSFFVDESGVIRGAPYGKANGYRAATKDDPALPQQ